MNKEGKVYSWTASHIESEGRIATLEMMIQSLVYNGIDYIHISISYEEDMNDHLSKFIDGYKELDKIVFFIHNSKKKQFEHLRYLSSQFKGDRKDQILFIDDDDLYLRKIEYDSGTIIGLQYIPIDTSKEDKTYNMSYEEILSIEDKWKDRWSHEPDFSGYRTLYSNVESYFKEVKAKEQKEGQIENEIIVKIKNILNNLEDTVFMNYLDNMKDKFIPKIPIVFHRIWSDASKGNVKTWLNDIVK